MKSADCFLPLKIAKGRAHDLTSQVSLMYIQPHPLKREIDKVNMTGVLKASKEMYMVKIAFGKP